MGVLDYTILIVLAALAVGVLLRRRAVRRSGHGCDGNCGACSGCAHHH